MPDEQTQISAFIARETNARLDRYVRETGAKKGRVIEDALDSYLSTLDEVPAEYVVPRRVVLTDESFDGVLEAIGSAAEPTAALRDLMSPR